MIIYTHIDVVYITFLITFKPHCKTKYIILLDYTRPINMNGTYKTDHKKDEGLPHPFCDLYYLKIIYKNHNLLKNFDAKVSKGPNDDSVNRNTQSRSGLHLSLYVRILYQTEIR